MVAVSRTHGPLHFEDLEPKRFEDLVRQLLYDFRPWQKLEPTGRSGGDDGFDARATEIFRSEAASAHEEYEAAYDEAEDSRTWLIQCKREKNVSPKKLLGYLDQVLSGAGEPLYGVIFVAACDFSKTSRDRFNAACRAAGLREWFLLGKADLEDMLYRPQYDRLLFGYFGVSLGRGVVGRYATLRKTLAGKRKAARNLSVGRDALVRVVTDETYPSYEEGSAAGWLRLKYLGSSHEGLKFELHRHFAILTDGGEWDAAFSIDDVNPRDLYDDVSQSDAMTRDRVWKKWVSEGEERAWLTIVGYLPYDRVVDIDADGDELAAYPHLYIEVGAKDRIFPKYNAFVERIGAGPRPDRAVDGPDDRRISRFDDEVRTLPSPYPRY